MDQSEVNLTHYEILGVPLAASRLDIKQAFMTRALETHPDRQPAAGAIKSDTSRFERIQAAWDCLQDAEQRQQYDQTLYIQSQQQSARRQASIPIRLNDCYSRQGLELPESCLYKCRCGQELDVYTEVNDLLDCTVCSLVYDTSSVFQDGDGDS